MTYRRTRDVLMRAGLLAVVCAAVVPAAAGAHPFADGSVVRGWNDLALQTVRETSARKNAVANGREAEFDEALDRFCDEWDRGANGHARFEKEYLIVVGTRR